MHQTFTPIHNSSLGLQLKTAMAGLGVRHGFFQALPGLEPTDQNHAIEESQSENLKSLLSSPRLLAAGLACLLKNSLCR